MISQQLLGPRFDDPADAVRWMGAVQAQDIRSVKWAVGLRTTQPALSAVCRAIDSGRILRTHILRPTWHLVPGRDLKWMAALSERKIISGIRSYGKQGGIAPDDYMRLYSHVIDALTDRELTKTEISAHLTDRGIRCDERLVVMCLSVAEAQGVVCSGAERNGKHTYALYEQRIPDPVELTREEALAELARRYFQSHGPATAADFSWWSGLGAGEVKAAIASLGDSLVRTADGERELYHFGDPYPDQPAPKVLHLLPPYDEYLISYTDRSDCLKAEHTRFAHNSFGIFQPVILHNGRITGNWRKSGHKTGEPVLADFFPGCRPAARALIAAAWKRYSDFLAR